VEQLVAQMDLPQRLRDAGVSEELLPKLAENMLKSSAVQQNPKALPSPDQALALLRMAW
jgi:alcohol dehydrogenase class IV